MMHRSACSSGEPLLAPQEILVGILSISPQRAGVQIKSVISALNACIAMRAAGDEMVFPPEALASTLQQLVVRCVSDIHPDGCTAGLPKADIANFCPQPHVAAAGLQAFVV
jgi:hypothetical protein